MKIEKNVSGYLQRFLRDKSKDEINAAFDAAMDRVVERETPEWDGI